MPATKRLVEALKPSRYRLDYQLDMANFKFDLAEVISFELLASTDKLELHCKGPQVGTAAINGTSVKSINYDAEQETVILSLAAALQPGDYELRLQVSGDIQDSLHGFYRSRYQLDGQEAYLATTQFEATHAREALVCVDEPAAKAVFDLSITAPADLEVVANTPAAKVTAATDTRTHNFESTPIMSTYLLAFVIGKLEAIETKTQACQSGNK